jgi:hypothetical protein
MREHRIQTCSWDPFVSKAVFEVTDNGMSTEKKGLNRKCETRYTYIGGKISKSRVHSILAEMWVKIKQFLLCEKERKLLE